MCSVIRQWYDYDRATNAHFRSDSHLLRQDSTSVQTGFWFRDFFTESLQAQWAQVGVFFRAGLQMSPYQRECQSRRRACVGAALIDSAADLPREGGNELKARTVFV